MYCGHCELLGFAILKINSIKQPLQMWMPLVGILDMMNPIFTNARTGRSVRGAKSVIASLQRTTTPSIRALSERKQKRGVRQIQIVSKNIGQLIARNIISKRSSENMACQLIGLICKCKSRIASAWDANVICYGQTSRTRRTWITATNLEMFAGYYVTDATRSSAYAKTQPQFFNLSLST